LEEGHHGGEQRQRLSRRTRYGLEMTEE